MCVWYALRLLSLSLSRCVQRAHMYRAPIGSSPFASLVIVGCCFFFSSVFVFRRRCRRCLSLFCVFVLFLVHCHCCQWSFGRPMHIVDCTDNRQFTPLYAYRHTANVISHGLTKCTFRIVAESVCFVCCTVYVIHIYIYICILYTYKCIAQMAKIVSHSMKRSHLIPFCSWSVWLL